jgi:hypothetical protein
LSKVFLRVLRVLQRRNASLIANLLTTDEGRLKEGGRLKES